MSTNGNTTTRYTATIRASFYNYEDTFDSVADAQAALDQITQGWDRAMWDEASLVTIEREGSDPASVEPEEPYRQMSGGTGEGDRFLWD